MWVPGALWVLCWRVHRSICCFAGGFLRIIPARDSKHCVYRFKGCKFKIAVEAFCATWMNMVNVLVRYALWVRVCVVHFTLWVRRVCWCGVYLNGRGQRIDKPLAPWKRIVRRNSSENPCMIIRECLLALCLWSAFPLHEMFELDDILLCTSMLFIDKETTYDGIVQEVICEIVTICRIYIYIFATCRPSGLSCANIKWWKVKVINHLYTRYE